MKIILYNPAHNGDQFLTLAIVTKIINDNLDKEFIIMPACCYYLFNDLLSDRVHLEYHPVIWNPNNTNNINNTVPYTNIQSLIPYKHDDLWFCNDNNIYINIWKLLVSNNDNCISLLNRPAFIKQLLYTICNVTNVCLQFQCDNYIELIPTLPTINVDIIYEKIQSYNKIPIFFYNQNSGSGFESEYDANINENIIMQLIQTYDKEKYIIILSKPFQMNLNIENLINVENAFGIMPELNGKNLIINAYIANMCQEVYFKNNGGSFFILNTLNIKNSNNVKYNFFGSQLMYDTIITEYGLHCVKK